MKTRTFVSPSVSSSLTQVSIFLLCLLFPLRLLAQIDILFVGNSFTHGNIQPTLSYNNANVFDANGTGYGGVPGIFQQMTVQAGLSYNVTIEAVSGQTLEFHFANRASIIGQTQWDAVVLQEFSTRPVPTNHGGNPAAFATGVANLANLIRTNSGADIFLYETWARPDQVFPAGSAYAGEPLSAMQLDLHNAYFDIGGLNNVNGIAPVGDAFLSAIAQGFADANPYDGITAGTYNLWASDSYHASRYGSYLAAATLFATITGVDPRTLGTGAGSAAAGLGIGALDAAELNNLAYQQVFLVPEPSAVVFVVGALGLACLFRRRRQQA